MEVNMRKLFLFVLIQIILGHCLFCLSDPPANNKIPEWTILVFLNGDNNLESAAIVDFLEMATVGSSDNVNIVVQFDRSPIPPPDQIGYDQKFGNWANTLRFLVRKDMLPEKKNAVMDLGEIDMGSKKSLTDFVTWGKSKYPAKKCMLIIWDHGQGWKFSRLRKMRFPDKDRAKLTKLRTDRIKMFDSLTKTKTDKSEEIALSPNESVAHSIKSVSNDGTSHSQLYNRAIQDGLQEVLAGKPIDVIGFDACLMSMMETAYALRKTARVMVASPETEPGDGWDYANWLKKLTDNPTVSGKDLGKIVVDSYRETYIRKDEGLTLAEIDLETIPKLAYAVDNFAGACMKNISSEFGNILSARKECISFGCTDNLHGIDMVNFCKKLAEKPISMELKNATDAVMAILASSILHNYAGKNRIGRLSSNGLAIYFPESYLWYEGDPDKDAYLDSNTHYPVEFVQEYKWDNFLQEFLTRTKDLL
jgi:hypothetical protein